MSRYMQRGIAIFIVVATIMAFQQMVGLHIPSPDTASFWFIGIVNGLVAGYIVRLMGYFDD